MKTFTIDTDNNICAFATRGEAAVTGVPVDTFSSQKELAQLAGTWPAERLVAIWNSLPGVPPLKGLKSAKVGASRICERIQATSSSQFFSQASEAGMAGDMSTFSQFLFSLKVTPAQGLGPLFNDQSCGGCHSSPIPGGEGVVTRQDEHLVGSINSKGVFDNLEGRGGPVARAHSVAELGAPCGLTPGIPQLASIVALRNAMALRGDGVLDTIAMGDVIANMACSH